MSTTTQGVVVQYRTTPEHAEENVRLIEDVYRGLDRDRPEGFHYATLRLDDGVTFMHVASVEDPNGANPLDSLPEFAAFSGGIGGRCEEPPVVRPTTLVGSYRMFDAGPATIPLDEGATTP